MYKCLKYICLINIHYYILYSKYSLLEQVVLDLFLNWQINTKCAFLLDLFDSLIQFILCLQIKLVNINSSDLVDGRPPVVLGLIWTIILYFQVTILSVGT